MRPIEIPQPLAPAEVSASLEGLRPEQLAELASNLEQLANVRAEVHRRLKDDPRKANFLTFRWLVPTDEKNQTDALEGLIACCQNAIEIRLPYGLFPRGYPDTKCGVRTRLGGIAKETEEAIRNTLVDRLYGFRNMPASEIVLTALSGGFQTDADTANALRRRVHKESTYLRKERKYRPLLFKYGGDEVSKEDEGEPLTLFEVTRDEPESRANAYNNLVEIITREKMQIVEELGEEGWTAWEEILELVNNELVSEAETGNSQNERDRKRAITGVFERVYGVKERWACTLKGRFLATFKQILNAVQANDGPRKSTPEQLRALSVFLPPVVPMRVIQRTSGMPTISRLLKFNDKLGVFPSGWGDKRSSVGRDVPPDEWHEIKARLKGESGG